MIRFCIALVLVLVLGASWQVDGLAAQDTPLILACRGKLACTLDGLDAQQHTLGCPRLLWVIGRRFWQEVCHLYLRFM
jgi:hypothetical protein